MSSSRCDPDRMEKHLYVVFTNAVDGMEDEFNDWYTNRHIVDLVALDGFESAQRYELDAVPPEIPWRYLCIYEIPQGQLETAKAALAEVPKERQAAEAEGREPRVLLTPALADSKTFWCTAITARFTGD